MLISDSLTQLEKDLWEAADQLRANSKLTATEYSMPVLGLLFLRYAHNRFVTIQSKVEASLPDVAGRGKRLITKEDFLSEKAIYLPEKARFDYLAQLKESDSIGKSLNNAMKAIEAEYPNLAGVLPKNYNEFEDKLLHDLLRIFDRDAIRNIEGDAFGKIYEYFLNEFAMSGAQEGGEFFTPSSLVNTIVNVIKPDHGTILDPACGSAGMFVQTGYFIESEGFNPNEKITFFGQEKTTTNTRIAKMNLAVHGLEGKIAEANTFYNDEFALVGKCDFVMANPPFNVDGVDKSRDFVKNDPRLLTTISDDNQKVRLLPRNDNANYLWIQYFYGYLNENGRAGFVMASSASDAGHSEKDIREQLVKTGAVDVMLAIGTNFFYTRALPCTLWFFDRAKEKDKKLKNRTLMLDARSIFRKVTRKIFDFSPEQLKNITVIVDLYRGENINFINLVDEYLRTTISNLGEVTVSYSTFIETIDKLHFQCKEYIEAKKSISLKSKLESLTADIQTANSNKTLYTELLSDALKDINLEYDKTNTSKANKLQHSYFEKLSAITQHIKEYRTQLDHTLKQLFALTDAIQKEIKAEEENNGKNGTPKEWKIGEVRKAVNEIEESKKELFTVFKQTAYFYSQIKWLQSRFPEAAYADVEGLCKLVSQEEIAANDYSLTPGRYVGVAPRQEDDFDFEERMREIKTELESLNEEAAELAKTILANLEELGI